MFDVDDRVWHYVKPNETTRIPRRHIFLDTEADEERIHNGRVQTFKLAVARYRTAEKGKRVREWERDYRSPVELWEDVSRHAAREARTILWAHNLPYDLRIAAVFTTLPRMGWRLDGHNLSPRGTWLQWRRGKQCLVMVDSGSVFPTTLQAIGTAVGKAKENLPLWTDDEQAWWDRCRQDVAILRDAVVAYLEWLDAEDMGNWQMTGAGQSWATFRHKFMTHKLLVHNDEEALAAERRALWTGRCEAYWHGSIDYQEVHEYDFTLAYARIAQQCQVPVRLLGPMPDGYNWQSTLDNPNVALLAEVTVHTDLPVVPASVEGRIAWPVGQFQTVLWDVEISAALRAGAHVEVGRAWLYRARPALREWATWIIDQLESKENECPAWRKLILKHWSRALIGRMAMTYSGWEDFAIAPEPGLRRSTVYDRDEEETYELLQVGDRVWRSTGRQEWSNSMPMITGYVQAVARVRLWDVIRALPPEAVLYVDTDSILTTDRWTSTVEEVANSPIGNGLRLKTSWHGFAIYGPRQIRTGTKVRIAGVPTKAVQVDRHVFAGEVWESVGAALKHEHPDRVVIRSREWKVTGVDHRRKSTGIGWTEPIQVGPDDVEWG